VPCFEKVPRLARHHDLLVGRHCPERHAGAGGGEVALAGALGVLGLIQRDAEPGRSRQTPARIRAEFSPMPPVKTIASAPPSSSR
jgi:hypothetical protein